MNGEWAAGGMPVPALDHPDMAAGAGASPHSSQSGSHGGHSQHSYHQQQQQQHKYHQNPHQQYQHVQTQHHNQHQHHAQHSAQHHQQQQQYHSEGQSGMEVKQPLQQHQKHQLHADYDGSNSSAGGSAYINEFQSGCSNTEDGPEDWQEREERLLIKQQQMLTEMKRSQKSEQKAKARISELRTSLREALRENEDLLKDMEKMIFNYETLEKKHDSLTDVCAELQVQLEHQPLAGDGQGYHAEGMRSESSITKAKNSGNLSDIDAELLETMEQEQDFLIQKLEISQQNCQAWKDRAHAMKQQKKDLKKKCKHLEGVLRGCPNCQYELQQHGNHHPTAHNNNKSRGEGHNRAPSDHVEPPQLPPSNTHEYNNREGYEGQQGQGQQQESVGSNNKHLQALNAGMQILNNQQSHPQQQQHQRQSSAPPQRSKQHQPQQQPQPQPQGQPTHHRPMSSASSVGSNQSFSSHGTPRYQTGSGAASNNNNSDSHSISSRSTTRKNGLQPSAMDRLVAMAKHSTSVRQLQQVQAEQQQQQKDHQDFDNDDFDDDEDQSIASRSMTSSSSRGGGSRSVASRSVSGSVKHGATRHNRRPSCDLNTSGSSGSQSGPTTNKKDRHKDMARQDSVDLFGNTQPRAGEQGDVASVAESYKQAKEIINERKKRRSTAANSQAAHSHAKNFLGAPETHSLRSESQRHINHYHDPEDDDRSYDHGLMDSGDLGGSSFYDGSTMTSDSNLRRSSGESIQLVIVPGDGSGESQTLEIKAGHKSKGGSIILMGGGGGGGNGEQRNRRRTSIEFNAPSSGAPQHSSRHHLMNQHHEPLLQQPDYHDDQNHHGRGHGADPESEQEISDMHESQTSSLASWDRARRDMDQWKSQEFNNSNLSQDNEHDHDQEVTNQRVRNIKQKHMMAGGGSPVMAAGEESHTLDAFRGLIGGNGGGNKANGNVGGAVERRGSIGAGHSMHPSKNKTSSRAA